MSKVYRPNVLASSILAVLAVCATVRGAPFGIETEGDTARAGEKEQGEVAGRSDATTGAASSAARRDTREALRDDAVSVFHCAFGEDWDVNYDRWPDRWVRKNGPDYPHYVSVEIADEPTVEDGKCLRIDLDGAAAAVVSPPIRVMSRFSYTLEAKLNNEGLERSVVVITLDFLDAAGRLLRSARSQPIANTDGWRTVVLERVEPGDAAIDRAVVGLEVIRGRKGDLRGRVSLDDVRINRMPRISVTTNNPFNVYTSADDVVVKCELSGIRERDPEIQFQLLRGSGELLDTGSVRVATRLISDGGTSESNEMDGVAAAPASYEGSEEWRPRISEYGYYRVVVKMRSSESATGSTDLARERTVWLAVVPPLVMPAQGEFGWSLPNGDDPLSLDHLSRLLPQVGIHWVKLPVWFDASNPRRGDELIRFVEMVGASNIEVVGVIDGPPQGTELAARTDPDAPIADVLAPDPAVWSPSLEPVMTRLSLRVRRWQIGRDYDTGFAAYSDLNKRISVLRTNLFRFGQDVRLGLCWDWDGENQARDAVAWDFQQNCLSARPSQEKLDGLLAKPRENSAERWVLIEPPPRDAALGSDTERAVAERFREFVLNLVSAKEYGADAIIVPDPFNDRNGLMHAGGMPGELLLPWRTTAAMLGGAKFLGRMQLPGGSENRVFIRPDGKVVMVVWNDEPTQEVMYLGKHIERIDILGRTTTPAQQDHEQVIDVGPLPTFVLGLHEEITRWRMALDFDSMEVPSVFSRSHPNALRFHNYFGQGVGGSVTIVVPQGQRDDPLSDEGEAPDASGDLADRWSIEPARATIRLAKGEDMRLPFEVRLRRNALFGKQPVRIDFDVEADEHYKFSVYRDMEVGTGNLTLKVRTYLDKDGSLVVEQVMTNSSNRLPDFKCYLYGGPRRQRMQVYRLGVEEDKKIYRFSNGKDLLGKEMLLEIEEISGERVLRHRFVVTNSPHDDDADATRTEPADEYPRRVDESSTVPAVGIGA